LHSLAGRSRRFSCPIELHELSCGAAGVAGDVGFRQPQPVAEQEPDLDVAPHQAEERAKAVSGLSKASSLALRAASSSGFRRSPMAKRPLASTI
jgi:hypothetical protein